MKYFYLYIFLLCCFIFIVSYYNTYSISEAFRSKKQNIILLGDSVLKNNAYTFSGKSVEEMLLERSDGNVNVVCLAVDDSKINSVYNQISEIPNDLNNSSTTIFISIGGNNILSHYITKNEDPNDTSILSEFFTSYVHLIESIQKKMNKAKIILLDIYYPYNNKYKPYHNIINEWNNKIYNYASDPNNNITGVLKISSIVTNGIDFSEEIEPSNSGGLKIVDAILIC